MNIQRKQTRMMLTALLALTLSGIASAQDDQTRDTSIKKARNTRSHELRATTVPEETAEAEQGPAYTHLWSEYPADIHVYCSTVDLEGNVYLVGGDINDTQTFIEKIEGASNPPVASTVLTTDYILSYSCAVDLDGNLYVAGRQPATGRGRAMKLSPFGAILWQMDYGGGTISNLILDPDGVPFVTAGTQVRQLNPANGIVAWQTSLINIPNPSCTPGIDTLSGLALGGNGALYTLGRDLATGTSNLIRLQGGNGDVDWCADSTVKLDNGQGFDMAVDSNGSIFVAGQRSAGDFARIQKFSSGGALIGSWNFTDGDAAFHRVIPAPDGTVVAGGARFVTTATDNAFVVKFHGDLSGVVWSNFVGDGQTSRDYIGDLDLDGIGNAYVTVSYGHMVTQKYAGDSGALQWSDTQSALAGFPYASAGELVVDPGGSVFSTAKLTDGIDGAGAVFKYSQPYNGAIPSFQTASANLMFEDQSIWAPGTGALEESTELFSQSWGPGLGFNFDEGFWIPFLGDFGGIAQFFTGGTLTAGVKAEVNGGSVDVQFPFDVEFRIPPSSTISPGAQITITPTFTPDPAARMTSCFTPTFNAGLTAEVDYDIFARASLTAFSNNLFDTTFLDESKHIPEDYIPDLNLLDIMSRAGLPVPGEWMSVELPPKGLFTAEFRTPQLFAQGGYDPVTESFNTEADDRFFQFGISVTEALLKTIGGTAQFDFQVPENSDPDQTKCVGGSNNGKNCTSNAQCPDGTCKVTTNNILKDAIKDFGLGASAEILQLIAKVDLGARQEISAGVVPQVEYQVMHNGSLLTTVGPQPITQDLEVNVPAAGTFNGRLDIIPTIKGTNANFNNMTDIEIFPGIKWKTLDLALSATAFGFEIITFNQCFFCYDWDLSEIAQALGLPGFDLSIPIFNNSWPIAFNDQRLPCFRINGSLTNLPRLVGASRDSLSMVIYDQTSPRISSFNVSTFGTAKMLLYGERLISNSDAFIEYWGRIEELPTTYINDNTLLVEVPNRFRLLPGVAKIYVTTSAGISETIDMPIKYPVPRLDAVNPNLWAADPDLALIPVSVIDAKSFAGNDTYIARRDYYILMRNELWTDITTSDAVPAFAGSAAEYFPDFDFNQMPGFPAVLWGPESPECRGGTDSGSPCTTDADCGGGGICTEMLPLPRFVQPVDNGIHNVRLADHQYDRPQAVPVRICNPGPGGGKSNELTLTIAAPIPVATHVEPADLSPTDIEFAEDDFDPNDTPVALPIELRVHGPNHVPTFHGYEEPKYGNFNADSVVRFDGVDLPTTYTSSFLLEAELPAEYFSIALENPSLDDNGGSLDGWQTFGNVFVDTVDFESAPASMKLFGNFSAPGGVFDVSGAVQSFDAIASNSYTFSADVYVSSSDPLLGTGEPTHNWASMRIAFFDKNSVEISGTEVTVADGTTPVDVWHPVSVPASAPSGTVRVEAVLLFKQPADDPGAVLFDNLSFTVDEGSMVGDHLITVYTPGNGTRYFEEKWVDWQCTGGLTCAGGTNDGLACSVDSDCGDALCVGDPCFMDSNCSAGLCEPATKPYFQGLVDSGGESAPVRYRIAYRQPDITSLSPPGAELYSPAFNALPLTSANVCVGGSEEGAICTDDVDCPGGTCDEVQARKCVGGDNDGLSCVDDSECPSGGSCDTVNAPQYNVLVHGTDFRDGAEVYFDGQLRDTLFVNSELLRVTFLPEDVATEGLFPVTVTNPAPDAQVAAPQYFEVAIPEQPLQQRLQNITDIMLEYEASLR